MLQIKHVSKTFNKGTVNEKQALRDLNLTLKEGDFVTIIGGNGAGKSTMLNAIAGVWPVDEGQIIIDDKDVTKLPEYKRAAFLGRVPGSYEWNCSYYGNRGKSGSGFKKRNSSYLKTGYQ